MKKEIWKDIKGYEDLYQVSNRGRVKSLNKFRGYAFVKSVILKPFKVSTPTKSNPDGYRLAVGLRKNGKNKIVKVHRLVAQTFFPNFKVKLFVSKKKKNPDNNSMNNLRISECTGIGVIQFSKRGKRVRRFANITQASDATGVGRSGIGLCAGGIWNKAGGYRWKSLEIK